MDTREMKSLEDKTRAIVETLSKLEGETRRQERMGDRLEQSSEAVRKLTSELTEVVGMLAQAIQLLQKGTFAQDIERLDAKIDEVTGLACLSASNVGKAEKLCAETAEIAAKVGDSIGQINDRVAALESVCSSVAESVSAMGEESRRRNEALEGRLNELEAIIGRIDRNTQKGFGKERG